ncbi:hypothetical protein [Natronobeatus ordinarius]|uniref:hypothetical protein n=1 Tax=Natronobeatus ordinarius TaxID=2963433 RepID=UPI0020CDD507|nr:hypothetical protein [Natronobeatus ordinarius]
MPRTVLADRLERSVVVHPGIRRGHATATFDRDARVRSVREGPDCVRPQPISTTQPIVHAAE